MRTDDATVGTHHFSADGRTDVARRARQAASAARLPVRHHIRMTTRALAAMPTASDTREVT
jgi:hypothetical protein